MERPSGVSSAKLASCAASASSSLVTPSTGRNSTAWRLPRVMVPVLSSNKVLTSPAASTALPLIARTLCCITRHEARADALDLVRSGLAAREHGAVCGFDGDGLEAGLALLDVLGHAGDGAAGAHAADEDVHFAVCVVPDFRAVGGVVDGGVGGVVKLPQDKSVGGLGKNLIGLGDSALHAVGAGRQHDLRAKSMKGAIAKAN